MGESLTVTHGCSLSNLPLFVAIGAGMLADEGLQVRAPHFEDVTTTAALLASGEAQIGTAAFIQPLMDAHSATPTVLVAGSGLMGVVLLAQPDVFDIRQLAGRAVGTFRADPMQVLLHDALAAAGMSMSDVDLRYLEDLPSAIAMFADRALAGLPWPSRTPPGSARPAPASSATAPNCGAGPSQTPSSSPRNG